MVFELYELIIASASKGLIIQNKDGSFPKGHDGPWYYEDTFLRTTAHWALLISRAFELTGSKKFRDAALNACDYLLSNEARPHNYAFHCRAESSGKDQCNGLIGQAWVLEALIVIGKQLKEEKYLKIAREVINLYPYSYEKHSWIAIDIDGSSLGENKTLNQQIWFTSMVFTLGSLMNDGVLKSIGIDFYSQLHNKISFLTKGLIRHNYTQPRSKFREALSTINTQMENKQNYKLQKKVSLGYLPFLLYGIAYVVDHTPDSHFWTRMNKNFIFEAIKYVENNFTYGYLEHPDSYRWSYNPIGIEMAYILQVLYDKSYQEFSGANSNMDVEQRISRWLSYQINGYYNFNENLLNKNTNDPNILSSRFYEAIRLRNYQINI